MKKIILLPLIFILSDFQAKSQRCSSLIYLNDFTLLVNYTKKSFIYLGEQKKIKLADDTSFVLLFKDCFGTVDGKMYKKKRLIVDFHYVGIDSFSWEAINIMDKVRSNKKVCLSTWYYSPIKKGKWIWYDYYGNIVKIENYDNGRD